MSYRFDPADPVPSIGGTITSGEPVMRGGAFDQVEDQRFFGCRPPYLPLSSRSDVLVFETGALEEDCEVTGPVAAELWISSDCPDTDFTIKLVDVYPPSEDYPLGFSMNVTDGILRVRYRDSWENPSCMEKGKIYKIMVEAFPTSNLFAKGHKIRLDVSSSNFPHFDVNPNTGESEGGSARYSRRDERDPFGRCPSFMSSASRGESVASPPSRRTFIRAIMTQRCILSFSTSPPPSAATSY